VFKTGMNAFEYAVKFFSKEKLSACSSYIGVVKAIDRSEPMEVYEVLILCKNGSMFSRKSTLMVAANPSKSNLMLYSVPNSRTEQSPTLFGHTYTQACGRRDVQWKKQNS